MDLVKHYPTSDPSDRLIGTLDDVVRCARPVHFEMADDTFRYAGNGSAFVASRDETWMLFTASHVLRNEPVQSLRVLPTDTASRWLPPFKSRVRTASLLEGDTDLAGVACLTINLHDVELPRGESLAGINLRFPTAAPKPGDPLWIAGYPRFSRGVDYEVRSITAIGRGVWATYRGPGIGSRCHEVELTHLGDVPDLDGFSGSPVFWIGNQEGDLAMVQLAGMVLRGTVASRRAHYVEASVLVTAAETAATGRQTFLVRGADPSR
jgi:hypothetical protein